MTTALIIAIVVLANPFFWGVVLVIAHGLYEERQRKRNPPSVDYLNERS